MSVYCLTKGQWPLSSMKLKAGVACLLVLEVVGGLWKVLVACGPPGHPWAVHWKYPGQGGQSGPTLSGSGFANMSPGEQGHFCMVRLSSRPQTTSHPMAAFSGQLTRVPTRGPLRVGLGQGGPRACSLAHGLCARVPRGLALMDTAVPCSGTSMSALTLPQEPRRVLGPFGMQAPWLWGAAWRLASCYKKLGVDCLWAAGGLWL